MRASLISTILFAIPTGLFAQQRDTVRSDSARALRPVTVTETRAPATVGGASAVIVKPGELRASPAPLLEQALRESPFVHVRQNSRGEMELSIRGSDSRQVAVLMDGVPLTLGWDHRTDPSLVPVTGAHSLVIVRGLGSLLYGPNTLGGTIEVSHDDVFGRLGNGRVWGGVGVDETAAWVASAGAGRELEGVGGGVLSIRTGGASRAREGFALPAGARDPTAVDGLRTNSDLREADGFVATRWRASEGRSLSLLLSGFTAARGVPPEEHLASPRFWRYPRQERAAAALSFNAGAFRTPLGHGALEMGAGYHAGALEIESFTDRTYATVDRTESGRERTLTGRAVASHSLPRQARLRSALTFANVEYDEAIGTAAASEYRQQLLSGGAEVELPLGERTAVAGGAVYDRAATPLTGGRAAQAPLAAAGWRAGLTHQRASGLAMHTSVSSRARFPSLRELYSGALDRFVPNPDLQPERLLGVEGGVTIDRAAGPFPDATLQAVAFHHDLADAVVRTTLPPPDGRFLRVNRDRIRSSGVELMGGLALGSVPDRAVTVTADLTLQDIRVLDRTAPDTPRHAENNPEARGMVELAVPIPGRVRGFANLRHTGVQYCLNADSGSEMRLDPSTEANLAVERGFTLGRSWAIRRIRAVAALDNVGNVANFDQCGLPQPGRTFRIMLSFQ